MHIGKNLKCDNLNNNNIIIYSYQWRVSRDGTESDIINWLSSTILESRQTSLSEILTRVLKCSICEKLIKCVQTNIQISMIWATKHLFSQSANKLKIFRITTGFIARLIIVKISCHFDETRRSSVYFKIIIFQHIIQNI